MPDIKKSIKEMIVSKLGDDIYEILQVCKDENPTKLDFGLGKEGITLNDTEAIRNAYKEAGYAESSYAGSPKSIVGKYKRAVGKVVTPMLELSNRKSAYLNKYAYACYASELVNMRKEDFLKEMKKGISSATPYSPSKSQIIEWGNEFTALKDIFKTGKYDGIYVIFEYVLPLCKESDEATFKRQLGVRPDVTLLSKDVVLMLEFKDRSLSNNNSKYFSSQAKKYPRKVKQFHVEAENMKVYSALVFLQDTKLSKTVDNVRCCSKDTLEKCITSLMGKTIKRHSSPKKWIKTDWKNGLK